jgi:hypothetical protein
MHENLLNIFIVALADPLRIYYVVNPIFPKSLGGFEMKNFEFISPCCKDVNEDTERSSRRKGKLKMIFADIEVSRCR